MLLKYFYDDALAHASYLVGCQRTGEAIIVDPSRDIEQYLAMAVNRGLRIVGVAETHIHADYVSGAHELAEHNGAVLYVSDEGPDVWKYKYAKERPSQLLKEGDVFRIGHISFRVMHTPGHTPESISFVLTDEGGGATQPMGVFTGDFVFVGSIGRPDLLEEAAGIMGTAVSGAKELFQSVRRFEQLPEHLQVWPSHGAGSACGKGLGAIPSSTVGYEKLFNPALQIKDEQAFVDYILADQPDAPTYFGIMKRVNKEGPRLVAGAGLPPWIDAHALSRAIQDGQVIDLSSPSDFAERHVQGSINIPMGALAAWAGWIVDYEKPLYLICGQSQLPEATRVLRKMGMDNLDGAFENDAVINAGLKTESYGSAAPEQLAPRIQSGEVELVDVRSSREWNQARIDQARHVFLGQLARRGPSIVGRKTIVTQCLMGGRSAIAASILRAAGADVINMTGGITAWQQSGLPVQTEAIVCEDSAAACRNT